jgi:hypothetical protein
MAIPTGYISAERGTLIFPWGANRYTIEVLGLKPNDTVENLTFSCPNRQGYEFNVSKRPIKVVDIFGVYTGSDVQAQLAIAGLLGSANIQIGTGETWTGSVRVMSSAANVERPIDQSTTNMPKRIEVNLRCRFYGQVLITPIPAGA